MPRDVEKIIFIFIFYCAALFHNLFMAIASMKLLCRPFGALVLSSASIAKAFSPQKRAPIGVSRFSMSTQVNEKDEDILRVGLCQFQVSPNKEENHAKCAQFVKRAADGGAKLVVLPEIWASPYATAAFPQYAEILPNLGDDMTQGLSSSAQLLREVAMLHKIWLIGGSVAEKDGGKIYNTCLVFSPEGELVGKHRKAHLFDIDVPGGITFFESETLTAGSSMTDFDTPWCKIGLGICYDIRFAAYAMVLAQKGCKILIYPGAFNMTTGPAHWELLQRARALDNQCYVLTASPARTEAPESEGKYPHYTAWGHSTAVGPWGDVLASTDEKEDVVIVDLDLSTVEKVRASIPIMQQKRADLYSVE